MQKYLIAFISFVLSPICSAEIMVWSENGHAYSRVFINQTTWGQANDLATSMTFQGQQGYLATLTSQEENDFVVNTFSITAEFWLGGFQFDTSNEPASGWGWVTGEAWDYTNWQPGSPNNQGGGGVVEDALVLVGQTGGNWGDGSAVTPAQVGFIVEFDAAPIPEPGTTILFSVVCVALALSSIQNRRPVLLATSSDSEASAH